MERSARLDFKTWDPFSDDLVGLPAPPELGVNYIWAPVKAMLGRGRTPLTKNRMRRDAACLGEAKHLCHGSDKWYSTYQMIKYRSTIITSYSAAELIVETDRLIAIAGWARMLSMRLGIAYVAGMWADQLPRQLLWSAELMSARHENVDLL
ncbi:hypothetical protein GGR56DRAFT_678473 [Xylariaceae sp. FL0804]|nr:hypothetical protein GGR56DRAFT_678473 [Xylariaceae sp. FL0804]